MFPPVTVTVNQVQGADGQPWQPRESADVLLLGDSFTNIFSAPSMGWGEGAGLAPHLARALGRDIDLIAQNDSGAFATRKLLSEALGAGEDRLAGKKVVIWELAARELAAGDWKPFSYEVGGEEVRDGDWRTPLSLTLSPQTGRGNRRSGSSRGEVGRC